MFKQIIVNSKFLQEHTLFSVGTCVDVSECLLYAAETLEVNDCLIFIQWFLAVIIQTQLNSHTQHTDCIESHPCTSINLHMYNKLELYTITVRQQYIQYSILLLYSGLFVMSMSITFSSINKTEYIMWLYCKKSGVCRYSQTTDLEINRTTEL